MTKLERAAKRAVGLEHCHRCSDWLPRVVFSRNRGSKTGCSSACLPCLNRVADVKRREAGVRQRRRYSDWMTSAAAAADQRKKRQRLRESRSGKGWIGAAIRRAFCNVPKRGGVTGCRFRQLGYTPDELRAHLDQFLGLPCLRCGAVVLSRENSEIDHIVPWACAKTEAEAIVMSRLLNLRLLCRNCNWVKRDKAA